MEAETYWKTFNLCKELALSGSYIFNGLKSLDDMENFVYEEEVFEFLYSISVGIERLQKIAIVLKENITPEHQEDFEKSLVTHNHTKLMHRISVGEETKVAAIHNEFLGLLNQFYNAWRYDRFSISDYRNFDKEKRAFKAFLSKHLQIEITERDFEVTPNDNRSKKFMGKVIGRIVDYLYQIVERESSRLNVYTYEVRVDSKAYKIFVKKEFTFQNEDVFWKEVLIYILHNVDKNKYLKLYQGMSPLDFDDAMLVQYVKSFKNDLLKQEHIGQLDYLYEEIKNKGERLEFLDLIGNDGVYVPDDEDEELEMT